MRNRDPERERELSLILMKFIILHLTGLSLEALNGAMMAAFAEIENVSDSDKTVNRAARIAAASLLEAMNAEGRNGIGAN